MPFAISSISADEDILDREGEPIQKVPAIASLFTYGCPTRAPGDKLRMHSAINQLLMCPIPEHIKRKREAEKEKNHHRKPPMEHVIRSVLNRNANLCTDTTAQVDSYSPLLYLLTPNQMIDNDYNIPSYLPHVDRRVVPGLDRSIIPDQSNSLLSSLSEVEDIRVRDESERLTGMDSTRSTKGNTREGGWVETSPAEGPPKDGIYPILAMDCEMVSYTTCLKYCLMFIYFRSYQKMEMSWRGFPSLISTVERMFSTNSFCLLVKYWIIAPSEPSIIWFSVAIASTLMYCEDGQVSLLSVSHQLLIQFPRSRIFSFLARRL